MLPLEVIEEVRRLLDETELSHRKIAERLNISRGTVGAVWRGERGLYGRETEDQKPAEPDLGFPPQRCESCGGLVYKPCLLCRSREYRRRRKLLTSFSQPASQQERRVA